MDDINTVSYDQFFDIPSLGDKSKIIFSENVYNYLNRLINETKIQNSEKGCYLIGRKSISENGALCFYFDFCSSNFQTTNGIYANGGVIPTRNNKLEILTELEKYNSLDIVPCVMHFHTHNLNGFFQSFSDQDYAVYATMKQQFKCEIFGMLAAPNKQNRNNTFELSVVNCREPKIVNYKACANFYLIPNIYYCIGNQIFKVGTFQKNRISDKTIINEILQNDRYVQNYREWQGAKAASGIGKNPNNNMQIIDDNVGYIDSNNLLNFPYNNLLLEFTNVPKGGVR